MGLIYRGPAIPRRDLPAVLMLGGLFGFAMGVLVTVLIVVALP